ncbi:NUDIX hydrolase [Gordonia sihwensis]|uniref:NUDIX hydrolase n=1 Tax=Gordonia sihwensis TaxID=173559 RepID=UPI0027E1475E|nr:NUDIX domain-containing protein [Gordonia sihwensis]
MDRRIVVSAVVMRDRVGRVLVVRKRGSSLFMFPGGKLDPGESFASAAVREAREELGVHLDESSLRALGTFEADAANEPGHVVVAEVFEHPLVGVPAASAEIAEIAWVDPTDRSRADIAPLLRDAVFPVLSPVD